MASLPRVEGRNQASPVDLLFRKGMHCSFQSFQDVQARQRLVFKCVQALHFGTGHKPCHGCADLNWSLYFAVR